MQLPAQSTLNMAIPLLTGAFGVPVGLEQLDDLILLGFNVGSQGIDGNPLVLF